MRPLYKIASEIATDWGGPDGTRVNYAAKPYLEAMATLTSIEEMYFNDTARSIVLYFLANAATWRGETARRVKAELKEMAK